MISMAVATKIAKDLMNKHDNNYLSALIEAEKIPLVEVRVFVINWLNRHKESER
jgi:hypothetical protein